MEMGQIDINIGKSFKGNLEKQLRGLSNMIDIDNSVSDRVTTIPWSYFARFNAAMTASFL